MRDTRYWEIRFTNESNPASFQDTQSDEMQIHTCPPAAPILPVPSTMPVTVARASRFPLTASCLPRSAEMADPIMLDGPPMRKPVMASRTALAVLSSGESENA